MTRDEYQSFQGPLLEGDDKTIRAAARRNVRENGLDFALFSSLVVGTTPGCSESEYLSVVAGTAEQLVRDMKAEAKK